jgi:hypothetical protein
MIDISMTTFADFVAATGPRRLTVVRNAKKTYGAGYDPRTDYWRPLRKGVADAFTPKGYDPNVLSAVVTGTTDAKKLDNYRACVEGIERWAGKRAFSAGATQKQRWSTDELAVGVNPELITTIDGAPYVVKLYFKSDPLSKARVDSLLALLQATHGDRGTVGVLDIRRSKLYEPTREIPDLGALLNGEAAAFARIWDGV